MSSQNEKYYHFIPKNTGVLMIEEMRTKQCRRCGVEFTTSCRIRKYCDPCRVIVVAEQCKKANARRKISLDSSPKREQNRSI